MLDVFRSDAFGVVALTDYINKAQFKPMRLGQLGLFKGKGISTTSVAIEEKAGQLSLIQSKPRGGTPETEGAVKRVVRSFTVPHLPKEATVMADEVQGVRAFGSESATQGVQDVVNERLTDLRAAHEATHEFHRIRALQGVILDADGSTLLNLFTGFNVVQQTGTLTFSRTSDLGDTLRASIRAAQRLSEAELGSAAISGWRAVCGSEFFDDLVADLSVIASVRQADPDSLLRIIANNGIRSVTFAGVTFEEYVGSVGGQAYVAADEAYLFPDGADIFRAYYAPADFVEAVNTIGLPVYAKQQPMDFDRGIRIHTQSNPLFLNLRPRAVIKLTIGS